MKTNPGSEIRSSKSEAPNPKQQVGLLGFKGLIGGFLGEFSPRFIALGLLAGVLLAIGLTGCKSASPSAREVNSGGPVSLAGDYALVSVDGKTVPCVVSHEGHDVTVKSGRFTITADGACRSESVFCVAGNKDVHRVVDATYTAAGKSLTMRWKGAGTTTGTVSGSTFTMNNEGMIFTYRK
jgi:hypothetical protein